MYIKFWMIFKKLTKRNICKKIVYSVKLSKNTISLNKFLDLSLIVYISK